MLLRHVALVAETSRITFSELSRASAALQKQAMRDFGPVWEIQATVDAFHQLEDVPGGYWPIIIRDDIDTPGAAGVHEDKDGQPFSLVQFEHGWQLTASHECLEMIADPFGNRLISGQSPKSGQGRVEFLVEVCDPSEARTFGYTVNGILVSDFYTPRYFDPVITLPVRYSFTGAITKPRQVLRGGYLSWHDAISDHWFQETWFSGTRPRFRDLGRLTAMPGENLRSMIYRETPDAFKSRKQTTRNLAAARVSEEAVAEPANAKANSWRTQIDALISAKKASSEEDTKRSRSRK